MKYAATLTLVCAFVLVTAGALTAQTKLPALDQSPMDMAYYPPGFAMNVSVRGEPGTLVARAIYSRPQMRGRKIFGDLVPFGKVWRLGANEATELDVYVPVTIGGKQVKPGRYTLYTIPEKDHWTVILNSQTDTWGAFGYKQQKDVLRTSVPVTSLDQPVEAFSMVFAKTASGADLVMAWENTEAKLPLQFSE